MNILILHPQKEKAIPLQEGLIKLGHSCDISASPKGIDYSKYNVVYAMGTTNIPPKCKPPIIVNGDITTWKHKGLRIKWLAEWVQIRHGCFSAVVADPEDEDKFTFEYAIPCDTADPKSKDYIKTMERIFKEAC